MATSTRQSNIFGVNDWKTLYQTFQQANFQSYDFETLRKTFIDYLRTYYPETFNDYVESSEFIALLDLMAYMGQALAFRNDLNTRENFIDTAERRDSVIKLANLVSYNPKRNITAQGFLKVTSVQTTENVVDINGSNLSNLPILWNDPANPNWQEQFNSVLNASLVNTQKIGRPSNSQTILGIKNEEYQINIPSTVTPVVPFDASIDGVNTNFELVRASSVGQEYVYEPAPKADGTFNILYRNDKLGYGSANTGFFFMFKQGTLNNYNFTLPQAISNQVIDINIEGINNTDTWLFNTANGGSLSDEWFDVENIYANAYLQTSNSDRKIFSVLSRFNDQVSYVFGDGVFSEIPVGSFRAYVRAGNALKYSIDPTEMQNITVTMNYVSRSNRVERLTFTLTLTQSVSNAQTRESLANIKQRAPSRYYTQNRMVNGEDYNNFPYTQYNSIIKSKALNRSSVGVARNLDLLDPTGKYSSTNSFAEDGALYLDNANVYLTVNTTSVNDVVEFLTGPLKKQLASQKSLQYYTTNYTRYSLAYPPTGGSTDGLVYWNQSSVSSNNATGYFYVYLGTNQTSIPVGVYSSYNMKYISKGAMIKFVAPAGYYFSTNNKLVMGVPSPNDATFLWANVLRVTGDGYNNGQGDLANGTGPVVLSINIPEGAIADTIIPSFDNVLPNTIVQEAARRMELGQSFSLVFNNSLLPTQPRWSIQSVDAPNYFVNITSLGNYRYQVIVKSLAYFFGSVSDTRFVFYSDKVVYDPKSGKQLQDFVSILKSNSLPNSSDPIGRNLLSYVVGQSIESDGYVDDFSCEVSTINIDTGYLTNPDFFEIVTGYVTGASNIGVYTFFQEIVDANQLSRKQIIASSDVNYVFPTKITIESAKYEYPVGQLFYAYVENKFYKSIESIAQNANVVELVEQATYYAIPGRQGLYFQYRHNSPNTSRIDPATTNIIDLYLVTQAYYTEYQNWLQDVTGTIPEPNKPTITELSAAYSKLQDYKMLSDNIVFNSVQFKPLFGSKAVPALQATIKVVKSTTTTASDTEVRTSVVSAMNNYFFIDNWDFGDTFYFSELSAYLHNQLGDMVSSIILVPNDPTLTFGDLYEIRSAPYEIFVNGAGANDIVIISALTPVELNR